MSAEVCVVRLTKPPVLYLRPFAHDEKAVTVPRPESLGGVKPTMAYGLLPWIALKLVSRALPITREQIFVQTLEGIAPTVAIGRPGERLRPLGAPRVYIDHGHWQPLVVRLIRISRLIFLELGVTHGVTWEITQAIAEATPNQLLFHLPASGINREAAWRQFMKCLSASGRVPEISLKENTDVHETAFAFFTSDWQLRTIGYRLASEDDVAGAENRVLARLLRDRFALSPTKALGSTA